MIKMNVSKYNKTVVAISRIETIKIFIVSLIWGYWTLWKQIVLTILRSTHFEWNNIDNPPSCLVVNTFGQHSYVKLKGKGIKLHYVEAGHGNQQTVVLLHGFPDCWIGWYNQIPVLAEHFRVIALDLKGFGDSDKPSSRRSYRLEILLDELILFLSSLGITRCSIIGHDLGALLGYYLINLNPDLVSKFVAISCTHPNIRWSEIPNKTIFNNIWIAFCQLPLLPELDAIKNNLKLIDQCYKHLKEKDGGSNCIEAYKYSFSRFEDWTGPLNYFRNLPFYRLDSSNLRQIDVRCLLITGNADESNTLESVVKTTEYIQKYFIKVIDGAGHYPHQEDPEKVNEALIEFLLDPPLVRFKKEPQASQGIFSRMYESVTDSLKYSSKILSEVKNDPHVKTASVLTKSYLSTE